MSNDLNKLPLPLPEALQPWITLNDKFHVLICHCYSCQQVIRPKTLVRHLREKHQIKSEVRKEAEQYIQQWEWQWL